VSAASREKQTIVHEDLAARRPCKACTRSHTMLVRRLATVIDPPYAKLTSAKDMCLEGQNRMMMAA
jgi:hypothetical protein